MAVKKSIAIIGEGESTPEDKIAYSQMHLVFKLIVSMEEEETDKNGSKTEKRNRNEENRRQIVDFIADNGISDSKTISKAISILCLHPLK